MRVAHAAAPSSIAKHELARYGLMGFPLAFAALPLVVQWPAHAASAWGLPLALLGSLLLAVRLADALVDPWIGQQADRWFAESTRMPWRALLVAAACLGLGFVCLFTVPPVLLQADAERAGLLAWAGGALLLTYFGYSLAQVVHQAWAARMGGDATERARWVGAREACALAGVLTASVLPNVAGWLTTAAVLICGLGLALWALRRLRQAPYEVALPTGAEAPGVPSGVPLPVPTHRPSSPWSSASFRWLLTAYVLNGLAASIPASLVLFYVRDCIQAGASFEAVALVAYFGCAALAVPLWLRVVARKGLVTAWASGMLLSIAAFVGAASLGAGDTTLFAMICMASGLALGVDLVVPPALLAGVIQRAGLQGQAEGRWFGWWSMATKLTLALAAGIALPLVQALGYQPGQRDPGALAALAQVYALLPCLIKALALAVLWWRRGLWPEKPLLEGPLK
jgi:glycoside/pentoside/hexuronide:cation symporter, GPH family